MLPDDEHVQLNFPVQDKENENSGLVTYFQGKLERNDIKTAMLHKLVA